MAFEILDCTIRDGGYVNSWQFSRDLVREVYRVLSKGGVDIVELGFRNAQQYYKPEEEGPWRVSTEEELLGITKNINGAKISVMGDYSRFDLDSLVSKADSCVDLIRIAAHKNKVFDAIDLIEAIKKKGYLASLQCMGYSTYTEGEKRELLSAVSKTQIDYLYLADSYGSLFPFQIEEMFAPFVEIPGLKVGFHPHNNIQMAFANTLEAVRVGVNIVDTTLYGIGRGAGNLPTEIMLSYLSAQGQERYNVIPLLNCIEGYLIDLKKEHPWGYQLPYMISGIFNSHPNYSKDLMRRKEYSMEDIWTALSVVQKVNPVGFDLSLINELVNKGVIGRANEKPFCPPSECLETDACIPAPAAGYKDRHQGREFIVLANGPSLKAYQPKIQKFIDQYRPVVLGANFLNDLFVPDYHAFNNLKRFKAYVDSVKPESKLLLGINLPEEAISDYVEREWEPLVFRNILDAPFDIKEGMVMANCRTISVLLVAVAVAMGAKRVFVAGMDGYVKSAGADSMLFYQEKFDPVEHEINLDRHRWNDKFLTQIDRFIQAAGGEGIHILTPTGHSAFHKSIDHYIA